LQYPEAFYGAYPLLNTKLYLHIIEMKPNYAKPNDNRHLVFYNLLESQETFGILSTKMLPEIQSFPIFMNVGPLQINIKRNITVKSLSDKEVLQTLKEFHTLVFDKILGIIQEFTSFDLDKKENSFLIVPGKYEFPIKYIMLNNRILFQSIKIKILLGPLLIIIILF
jgi:endoribonuclease Dicer